MFTEYTTVRLKSGFARGNKGPSYIILISISRGAALIIPHRLQQQPLRSKSCPARPQTRTVSQRVVRGAGCMFCFPLERLLHSWTSSTNILGFDVHDNSQYSPLLQLRSERKHRMRQTLLLQMPQQHQLQPDGAAAAFLFNRLVRLWGAHAGWGWIQGVAGEMLKEEIMFWVYWFPFSVLTRQM